MNMVPDFPPPADEVRDQLKRMLSSIRFAKAKKISDFMKLVVIRKLAGKITPTQLIGKTLYKEKYIPYASDDVRVAANTLRGKLEDYYALEGKNDPVIISLPKPLEDRSIRAVAGSAYTPSFSYNEMHCMTVSVRIGYLWLHRWSYYNIVHALEHFQELLRDHPRSLGPTIGLVETLCHFDDRGFVTPGSLDVSSTSRQLLQQLVKPPENYWRLWAVRARVEMIENNLDAADRAFRNALHVDRVATESYLPYLYFLPQIGKRDEAFALAYGYLDRHMEDSVAFAQIALFFGVYGAEHALKVLQTALQIDPGNCCAHELAAIVCLGLRDFKGMTCHLKVLYTIYDGPGSFEAILQYCIDLDRKQGLDQDIVTLLEAELRAPFVGRLKE